MATEGPQVGSFYKNKQAAILWGASMLGNRAGREKERVCSVAKFKYKSGIICRVKKCQLRFQGEPSVNRRLTLCIKVKSLHYKNTIAIIYAVICFYKPYNLPKSIGLM
jgi:hypothetical protein